MAPPETSPMLEETKGTYAGSPTLLQMSIHHKFGLLERPPTNVAFCEIAAPLNRIGARYLHLLLQLRFRRRKHLLLLRLIPHDKLMIVPEK